MSNSNNVIQFPVDRVKYPARTMISSLETAPPALRDIKDVYYLAKVKRTEEMMQIILPLVSQGFLAYGMNLNDAGNSRNIALMIETMRSAIQGYFGVDHPLQSFAQNIFVEVEGKIVLKPMHVQTTKLQPIDTGPDVSNTA